MQNIKKMHACEAAGGAKLGKMTHWTQPTTGTSFGNFICTIIVCNDTVFIRFQVLKLIFVQKI